MTASQSAAVKSKEVEMTQSTTFRVLVVGGAKADTHGDLNKPEPEGGNRTFDPAA